MTNYSETTFFGGTMGFMKAHSSEEWKTVRVFKGYEIVTDNHDYGFKVGGEILFLDSFDLSGKRRDVNHIMWLIENRISSL